MELEQEARNLIENYLRSNTTRWVLGEGCSSSEYRREQAQMCRLDEIAATLGEDRVKAIWAEVRAVIRSEMADSAKLLIEPELIEGWLKESGTSVTAGDHDIVEQEIRLALNSQWR